MTKPERRTLATLAAAVLLPLVLFAALQAAFSMRGLRRAIEAGASSRAREIEVAIDGRLLADQSALDVLSTSHFLAVHDWAGARDRVGGVQRTRPRWRNVVLTDARTGEEIWETRSAPSRARPARPWIRDYLTGGSGAPTITGIVGGVPDCPCIAIHAPVLERGAVRYLLTAELGTEDFQNVLVARTAPGSLTAVVDRQGRFIARSLDYRGMLGKPATRFVRNAVAHARSGLYKGVSYEGLENYTAFVTSLLSGWSTHVAVRAEELRRPSLGSLLLTLTAGAAALLLAGVIAAFALRQLRARRQEEARNAQQEKLAAVGQLASGIAHDFSNLLMVISGNLKLISERSTQAALRKPIDSAIAAGDRGARLIQQLMAFTRSQPLDIGEVDVVLLLENLRGLLQQSVGRSVTLVIDAAADARFVTSNAGQLELAILNLAVNARDAMPLGGVLSLRTRPCNDDPAFIALDVVDTGEGMPKEIAERAMEPFFTTKPLDKGTGLGLAQVFGIVSQSGGSVEILSRPGSGTTIRLRLRRHRSA